jgi:hypothetical protein
LRAAIAAAGNADTVAFDSSLNGQTIALTSGAIEISKSLTINGPGASHLTIDGGHGSQIFAVTGGNLSISGLAFANGAAAEVGGAIQQTGTGSLTVTACAFSGNTAGGAGGGADYSNRGHGGAIYVSPSSGPTSVSASTFSANAAGGPGGTGFQSGLGSGGAIWDAGEALTHFDPPRIIYSADGELTVEDVVSRDRERGPRIGNALTGADREARGRGEAGHGLGLAFQIGQQARRADSARPLRLTQ